MVREEAIEMLNKWGVLLPSEAQDAVDMAIEALSQPPNDNWERYADRLWEKAYERGKKDALQAKAEPTGDLISRADAMAEFREWVKRANENGETPTWNDAVSLIGSLPSADAVQGEWIDMEILCNPYPPIFCVECSRCGYRVGRETFLENTFNFCPNCGAHMRRTKTNEKP